MPEIPPVPLTLEGSAVLHQMFRFRWTEWRALPGWHRKRIVEEATKFFESIEVAESGPHPNQSAVYSQLGHKGDLMLIHFRDTFEDLNRVELSLSRLELFDYLDQRHSYVSVVELGLYESSVKTYTTLLEQNLVPFSPEWKTETDKVIERQSAAMTPRLFPSIPPAKYLCFYPMNRRRGEVKNWYAEPMRERQRMMHDHGLIGRRYADDVRQIITGSIGFDDWEWGVDLFAEDPLVFKHLIYEMRFDEASVHYGEFGEFFLGVRLRPADFANWATGELTLSTS